MQLYFNVKITKHSDLLVEQRNILQPNATVNTIGPIVLSFESLPKDQSVSHVYNMMLGYEALRNSSKLNMNMLIIIPAQSSYRWIPFGVRLFCRPHSLVWTAEQ